MKPDVSAHEAQRYSISEQYGWAGWLVLATGLTAFGLVVASARIGLVARGSGDRMDRQPTSVACAASMNVMERPPETVAAEGLRSHQLVAAIPPASLRCAR